MNFYWMFNDENRFYLHEVYTKKSTSLFKTGGAKYSDLSGNDALTINSLLQMLFDVKNNRRTADEVADMIENSDRDKSQFSISEHRVTNGDFYDVFADNRAELSDIEVYDKLYATRAKKIGASNSLGIVLPSGSPQPAMNDALYISIEGLLDVVKDTYPNIQLDDVLAHYGIERPKSGISEDESGGSRRFGRGNRIIGETQPFSAIVFMGVKNLNIG